MINTPLRIGLIGYGLSGKVFHTPLFKAAGVELVAAASSQPDKVLADHPGTRIYSSASELIKDENVELVVLASPSFTHATLILECLESGKHVLSDKPFTATTAEADIVISAAKKTGLTVSCYQNRRYDADFLTLQNLINSGQLGEIVHYHARFDWFSPTVRDRWQEQDTPGVGNHYDLGAHLIDQALVLFGKPDWVYGDVIKQRDDSNIIDCFHLRMGQGRRRIDIGAGMLVAANTLRYQVHGTRGSWTKHHLDPQEDQLRFDGITPENHLYGYEDESHYGQLTQVVDGKRVTTVTPGLRGDWPRFYRELAVCIRENKPPEVTAEQARETINIIEIMVESARQGKRLEI